VSPFLLAHTPTHQPTHKSSKSTKRKERSRRTTYCAKRERSYFEFQNPNYKQSPHLFSLSLRPPTPAPPFPRSLSLSLNSRLQIPASIAPIPHVTSFSRVFNTHLCGLYVAGQLGLDSAFSAKVPLMLV
jgi:hypothetical protein